MDKEKHKNESSKEESSKESENMTALAEFIQMNKDKIRRVSEANTVRDKNGNPIIAKNDPWRKETEWDDIYRELDKEK